MKYWARGSGAGNMVQEMNGPHGPRTKRHTDLAIGKGVHHIKHALFIKFPLIPKQGAQPKSARAIITMNQVIDLKLFFCVLSLSSSSSLLCVCCDCWWWWSNACVVDEKCRLKCGLRGVKIELF